MLKDKYMIEEVPITKKFKKVKRFIEDRGELVLVADGEDIRHISYFSLNSGSDFFRGGHYHKKKIEKQYLISGTLLLYLKDVVTNEKDIIQLEAGIKITVYPFCAHKFVAIHLSSVIEYYGDSYSLDDDVKYLDF